MEWFGGTCETLYPTHAPVSEAVSSNENLERGSFVYGSQGYATTCHRGEAQAAMAAMSTPRDF